MKRAHHPRSVLSRCLAPGLVWLACLTGLPAQAMGSLADIRVLDRDSDEVLPIHEHEGQYWVAGRPGARYAIEIRNQQDNRLLAVTSVDGVNVVSGQTAAWGQTGYVLSAWQAYEVTGWRKSEREVAAFEFTDLGNSYAARTGRPAHVGVIGVALFRERPADPPAVSQRESEDRRRPPVFESGEGADASARRAAPSATDRVSPSASAKADFAGASQGLRSPRLGTGHGERESSHVSHTQFDRLHSSPDEVIEIRYDSRENLVAMGVLRASWGLRPPRAFPGSREGRYVPDPR